jgi:glycosyltransferase involved in cell wall biosynthesis
MTKNCDWREEPRDAQRDPRDLQQEQHVGAALVSVVIPCFNQAHFLGEAIESVLSQSYSHFEIVVVDDGSTDNTSEVAGRYPGVHCVRQENQGLAGARNSGLYESKGSYLVFLDADDRLLPDALKVGLECLKAHPECAFVSGRYREIAADESHLRGFQPLYHIKKGDYSELLRGNYIGMHATLMYRRSVLESVGGFDTSIEACEDYDLYLRIARNFPIHCHDKVVAEYRQHDSNMSRDSALMLKATLAILRSQRTYIKRHRHYQEAYKIGVRTFQDHYGVLLAWEMLDHVRERAWKQAIRDLLVLMRYYPRVFVRAWQKVRSSMLDRSIKGGT